MRIIFCGSSLAWPQPQRRCSATLIEVGERRYVIDMGCNILEDLADRHIPVESVKGVFITHMHGDHTHGLLPFLDLCAAVYHAADPVICLPEPLEQVVSVINDWIRYNHTTPRALRYCPVNPGILYEDEAIRVTAYPTRHLPHSHAFLVEAEGKRVLFTGDLNDPADEFPLSVLESPLDLAVCEAAHFDAEAYIPLFKETPHLRRLCYNHYREQPAPAAESISRALGGIPVFCAVDGSTVEW